MAHCQRVRVCVWGKKERVSSCCQFFLKSWVFVILLVTACQSFSLSSLFLLFINKWSPSVVLPRAFALLLIPAARRFLWPLWQLPYCCSIITHLFESWPGVWRDHWLTNGRSALSCSFYTNNEVIKFQYSRPVRKGEKDPDNEFAVCMLYVFVTCLGNAMQYMLILYQSTPPLCLYRRIRGFLAV